jgi:sugar transferase (PEP-CTERM/EpsH1 system associated)
MSDCLKNRQKKTVAHIVFSLEVGGLERVVVDLIRRIDPDRFRSVLCCLEREGDWLENVRDLCEHVAVMDKKPGLSLGLPYRLARVFKNHNVDIVHCHNFGPLLYGGLGGRLAGCRVVYTVHGPEISIRKRHVMFQKSPVVDRVVTVSDHVGRGAVNRAGLDRKKVVSIVNGIDTDAFANPADPGKLRRELGLHEDKPLLGVIARLTPEKDHNTLFAAMAKILNTIDDAGLIVVGDGPMNGRLRLLTVELGIQSSVWFLGTREDISDLLPGLDVFVLSSREEGFGITLLEAMAAGLPVVATKAGGIPEIVINGETGFLVDTGNSDAFADGVIRMLADKNRMLEMAEAGKKRARDVFGVDRMVHAYEALYEDVTR